MRAGMTLGQTYVSALIIFAPKRAGTTPQFLIPDSRHPIPGSRLPIPGSFHML